MCMNDKALLTIVSALECFPECPYENSWPDDEKEEISLTRWTLNEILDLVCDHPWTVAADTIENFILRCVAYGETSRLPEQKRVFSIAVRTALEILTELKENESCSD